MPEKFRNKYRIPSARLHNWDYGSNAAYFVTICTKNRVCYFGDINFVETPNLGVSTKLSEIGKIAQHFWHEIPNHFPFVELGEYVVMPDHMHGIIIINKRGKNNATAHVVETPKLGVFTIVTKRSIVPTDKWRPGILGVIINQYKRICTIHARKIHADFAWQTRFYDHIIRDDKSFHRITEYIKNNPLNWVNDEFGADGNNQ